MRQAVITKAERDAAAEAASVPVEAEDETNEAGEAGEGEGGEEEEPEDDKNVD